MWVKICGCRTPEGVEAAVAAGADAVGFIFAESRRRVTPELAHELALRVPRGVAVVAVVRSPSLAQLRQIEECMRIDMLQVSGRLPPGRIAPQILRTVYLGEADRLPPGRLPRGDFLHLDRRHAGAYGGSGLLVGRAAARRIAARQPVVLAGGLNPDNVEEAIMAVRPFGVDVASGVERDGRQDPERIASFVHRAKEAGR